MRMDIAAQTDIGRRKSKNEDNFGVFGENTPDLNLFGAGALLCVADGLGGHVGGEIASKLAVSMMRDCTKEVPPQAGDNGFDASLLDLLRRYVLLANASVYQTNVDMQTGAKPMGTTLIVGLVSPRKIYICNVGDSRVYHIRDGVVLEHTQDHSWVDEQVRLGLMSKKEAEADFRKNIVTRSIGTRPEVEVDTYLWHIVPGDWLLLCSDGLINMVPDEDIVAEFNKGDAAAEIVTRLITLANENGGKDNITAIAAHVSPNPASLAWTRLRAFVRRKGSTLIWLLAVAAAAAAAFAAGYVLRGADPSLL